MFPTEVSLNFQPLLFEFFVSLFLLLQTMLEKGNAQSKFTSAL